MFVVLNRSQNSSYRWRCGGKVSHGPLTAAARSLFLWFSVSVPVCERTWTCLLQAFGRCLLARSVCNNAGQTAGRIGLHLSESGQSVWSCESTTHTHTPLPEHTTNVSGQALFKFVKLCWRISFQPHPPSSNHTVSICAFSVGFSDWALFHLVEIYFF